ARWALLAADVWCGCGHCPLLISIERLLGVGGQRACDVAACAPALARRGARLNESRARPTRDAYCGRTVVPRRMGARQRGRSSAGGGAERGRRAASGRFGAPIAAGEDRLPSAARG